MNLKNKLKLSLIIAGVITSVNTNAQTFYQCVPEECPNGQYFNGAKCLALPTQQEVKTCPTNSTFHDGKCCKSCTVSIDRATSSSLTSQNGVIYSSSSTSSQTVGCSNCGSITVYNFKFNLAYGDAISYDYYSNPNNVNSQTSKTANCNTCTE